MTEAAKPLDEHSEYCKCAVCRPDLDRPEQRRRWTAHAEDAPAPKCECFGLETNEDCEMHGWMSRAKRDGK